MKWGLEYLLLICKNYFRVAAKHMPMENLDSRYQKYKHLIKNFTIMDDIFMRNVLKRNGEGSRYYVSRNGTTF